MLTAKEIYKGTMTFVWYKLILGAVTFAACAILGAICLLLIKLFNNGIVAVICYSIWVGGTEAVKFFLLHYMGYMVKAGHVAVVAQAASTGVIPDNQFELAKNMVKERFAEANVYFVLDNMVSGAIKQISRTFDNVSHILMVDRLPGYDKVEKLVKFYLDVAFGYVDECCLAWSFLHKDQSPFKSAADGVVIYFQNWKEILKTAAKAVAISLVGLVVATILLAIAIGFPIFILRTVTGTDIGSGTFGVFAFITAIYAARAIKDALLDSWTMVSMTTKFLELAPQTELKVDIYGKLCGLSGKFKELFNKGQADSGVASGDSPALAAAGASESVALPSADASDAAALPPADAPASGEDSASDGAQQ